MTTTFFLLRHAPHAVIDRVLVGRMPGVGLSEVGRTAAERLARRLRCERVSFVHASPQQRAQETATPVAAGFGLPVTTAPGLDEIDVGEWTGRGFAELADDPRWTGWNACRAVSRAPGGESMGEAQARVVRHIDETRRAHPDVAGVLVSHADVIKAALLFYLGAPLDSHSRLEISPASVSVLVVGGWGAKVVATNETVPA